MSDASLSLHALRIFVAVVELRLTVLKHNLAVDLEELGRYRKAPTFEAQVSIDTSEAAYQGLMQGHARRYPDEWGAWEERFANEYADGSRKILRYRPVAA